MKPRECITTLPDTFGLSIWVKMSRGYQNDSKCMVFLLVNGGAFLKTQLRAKVVKEALAKTAGFCVVRANSNGL